MHIRRTQYNSALRRKCGVKLYTAEYAELHKHLKRCTLRTPGICRTKLCALTEHA
jgi:hypothetical protein